MPRSGVDLTAARARSAPALRVGPADRHASLVTLAGHHLHGRRTDVEAAEFRDDDRRVLVAVDVRC